MKKNNKRADGLSCALKKTIRIMKIAMLLLFIVSLETFAANSYAQSTKIDLNLEYVTLKQVLKEIESKSEFTFFYNDEVVNVNRIVSVHAKKQKISEILDQTLDECNYTVDGKLIVITPKEQSAKNSVQQQKITVTGLVTDNLGEPMIGVSVSLKGSTAGIITDSNGRFSIPVNNPNDVLVFSYIGYLNREVNVNGQQNLLVTLLENTKLLDEIIVVGYGTQKKANLTGAVGTINTKEALVSRPVTNVQELFAGNTPGLNIAKESGAVGSGATMNIRGTSTIGNSSGVLVIIDGFEGNINTLNPNDIESVSVLKDAASSAIYGSRAANGVMLITTKKGSETAKPIIEVSSSIGIQNPQFKIDFVGSEDFMRMYDKAMINDGRDPIYGDQGQADLKAGKYADIRWYKEIYEKNTLINNNYVAFSGQQKNITYRFSGSYDYQDGTIPNNNYERYIIKPDMTIKLLDNLSFRGSLQYTETHILEPQGGTTGFQSQAARISPITFITTPQGEYGVGSPIAGNPIAGVNEGGYKKNLYKELMTILELNYSPIKNWNIKGNFANYTLDYQYKDRLSSYYLYDTNGDIAKTVNTQSVLKQSTQNDRKTTLLFTTDYSLSFNQKHNFKFLAGYSQEYQYFSNFSASRNNMPFDDIDVLDVGLSSKQNSGNEQEVAVQSVFGRINYDYLSKYLFEANIRADGSSRFAPGHQWGTFPSFSAGWNIHEENFMKNIDWLSSLKARASWGILGDANKIPLYETVQTLTYDPAIYVFNNALVPGAYSNKAVNRSLSWEQAAISNFGIDASFWDQRIKVSADYFINIRSKILYNPPVPLEFGLPAPYTNDLKMENRGYEVLLNYNDHSGDFKWDFNVNGSYSKNKVLDLGANPTIINNNTYTTVGKPYQMPYGYISDGLFQNQGAIDQSATQFTKLYPGNIKYKNLNDEGSSKGRIDGDDRAVITDKAPFFYGFNLGFGYKQFDFSTNFYGKLNTFKYLNGYEGWAFFLSQNARPMHKDAWTPENQGASYPRLTISKTANDYIFSSYWYRKADYLKWQNLQVGYTFSQKLLEKAKISYLRCYISGQNLATFSKYPGFDPEGGYYPLSQTWAFGINLKF